MNRFKIKTRPLWAACAVAALPLVAVAGDGPYIGLEGGANWQNNQNQDIKPDGALGAGDQSLKFKTGWLAGFNAGYAFDSGFRPELEFDFRRNQIRKAIGAVGGSADDGGVTADGFENNITGMGNLWYDIKTQHGLFSVVHPYIGGGVGVGRFSIQKAAYGNTVGSNDYDVVFAYQGGAGIGFDLTPNLTASVDWRYLETLKGDFGASNAVGTVSESDAKYRSNALMGGLRYSFGSPKPAPARYVPPPPPPAYVPPPPAPIGDSDGDGVPDNLDKCPGTPKGFKVDASGCIIEQTLILRGINFEYNKDTLTGPSKVTLDEVAGALKGQPSLAVQIDGYTDARGSTAYNLNLSKKRAESVRRYLVNQGVAGDNLVAKGFGKANPIATNDTEEGRAENRRVEFVVLNKPSNVKVQTKGSTEQSKAAAEGSEPAPTAKKHKRRAKAKATASDTTAQ